MVNHNHGSFAQRWRRVVAGTDIRSREEASFPSRWIDAAILLMLSNVHGWVPSNRYLIGEVAREQQGDHEDDVDIEEGDNKESSNEDSWFLGGDLFTRRPK